MESHEYEERKYLQQKEEEEKNFLEQVDHYKVEYRAYPIGALVGILQKIEVKPEILDYAKYQAAKEIITEKFQQEKVVQVFTKTQAILIVTSTVLLTVFAFIDLILKLNGAK